MVIVISPVNSPVGVEVNLRRTVAPKSINYVIPIVIKKKIKRDNTVVIPATAESFRNAPGMR